MHTVKRNKRRLFDVMLNGRVVSANWFSHKMATMQAERLNEEAI